MIFYLIFEKNCKFYFEDYSSGQHARFLLWRSELEARCSLKFFP